MGKDGRYLLKNGEVYYLRIRFPESLRKSFKSKQLKKSLHTKDLKIAQGRAKLLYNHLKILFEKAEQGMLSEKQIDDLANEYIRVLLNIHEQGFALKGLDGIDWTEDNVASTQKHYAASVVAIKRCLSTNNLDPANEFISWLREVKGLEPENEREKANLQRTFLKKCIPAYEVCFERLSGEYGNEYDQISMVDISSGKTTTLQKEAQKHPIVIAQEKQPSEERAIGLLCKKFIKENISNGTWRRNTVMDIKAHISLFLEHFREETPVENITRQNILDYKNNILKFLPKNRSKNIATRNLSLPEQLADKKVEKISGKTINGYLTTISSFFNWCVDDLCIIQKNVMNRKMFVKDDINPNERRLPYSLQEVENILGGLASLPLRGKNGQKNMERIWITMLAMHHGMRMDEICQLRIDNIICHKETPCIAATVGDDKKQHLKNIHSFRTIPIHPTLLKFGFLAFVNKRRMERDKIFRAKKSNAHEKERQRQLFITMTSSTCTGKHARNFSNFFNKFNRNDISQNQRKSFHSLRHNFSTALNNSSNVPYAVSYLDGHKFKTETDKTYTTPDMQILVKELGRLDYGIDIFKMFKVTPFPAQIIVEQSAMLPKADE